MVTLKLPASGIGVHTALAKNRTFDSYEPWHGEGIGLFSDWWTDGHDLNETIFLITNDEEMKEKLADIEFHLM